MTRKILAMLLSVCMVLTMVPTVFAATDVAALPEASGNVITLTADAEVDTYQWPNMSKGLTIDLAGHTLIVKNGKSISVPESQTLKLMNGNVNATEFADGTKGVFTADKNASIVLDKVNLTTNGAALYPAGNAAAVEVTDSTILAGTYAVGTNASGHLSDNVNITLKNSTFDTTGYSGNDRDTCTVTINVPGKLTVEGCTIKGGRQAVLVRGGDAKFVKSTIELENPYSGNGKDQYLNTVWKSGNEVPMAAMVIGNRVAENGPYNYPANCTLENTTVKAPAGFKTVYTYGMDKANRAVTFTYDKASVVGTVENPAESVAVAGPAVAEINGTLYATLQDAVEAAGNADIIKVLENIKLPDGAVTSNGLKVALAIPKGKTVTIDLNGKNVTCTESGDKQTNYALLGVEGNLTIQDSTATNVPAVSSDYKKIDYTSGEMRGGFWRTVQVHPGGHLTLKSGKITSVVGDGIFVSANVAADNREPINSSVTIDGGLVSSVEFGIGAEGSGAVLTVNNGVITASNNAVIGGNGIPGKGDTVFNINGGTMIGRIAASGYIACGIYHPQKGDLNISGGTIYADGGVGVEMRGGVLNMTGGSVIAAGTGSGKVGDSKVSLGCYGVHIDGEAGYYDYENCKVNISGNASVKSDEADCVIVTPADGQNKMKISGGYFTSDPSAYLAEGVTTVVSDDPNYVCMVKEAVPTDVKPAVGEPSVAVGSGVSEEDKTDVETAAKGVDVSGLAAHANTVAQKNDGKITKEQAAEALKEVDNSATAQNVNVYAQAYLDIKPTAYVKPEAAAAGKFTLDITPMCRLVASTQTDPKQLVLDGEKKNAVELKNTDERLNVTGPVKVSVPLPKGFVSATNDLYVQHKGYEYVASVALVDGTYIATFTNPHGFSEFTITTEAAAVAELNGVRYNDLQDALNAAKDKDTVVMLKEPATDKNYTVSGDSKTITLSNPSDKEITVTVNGTAYEVPAKGTVEVKYTRPSSGGGGAVITTYPIIVEKAVNGTVTATENASKGSVAIINVKADEGYQLDKLTVKDANGKELKVADKGNGVYTFEMPASKVTVSATFSKKEVKPGQVAGFTDVMTTDWFADEVKYAVDHGMMNGTSATTFSPNGKTTRGMIVTILYRLEKEPAVDKAAGFTDVAEDRYYAKAVAWASANGIVTGYSADKFGADNSITREQFAAILYRYAQYKNIDVTKAADLSGYADASKISPYAETAMKWANAEGLITGVTADTLKPAGDATRAQAAAILMRFCEEVAK